jgi:signal transduction histidine kinase
MASFTPPPSTPLRDIGQKATWPLVFFILLAATMIFIIAPVLAIDWVQRVPFPSVLLQPHLLVSDASGSDWGPTAQLDTLDRIVSIDDTPVVDQLTYDQALINAQSRGEPTVRVVFERSINAKIPPASPCGEAMAPGMYRCEATPGLQKLEAGEFLSLFVLPYSLGLIFLLIGIWVFRQRGNQRTSQVLALFAGTASIIFATYFDGLTTNRLQWVAYLAIGASSGAILSLSLLFPQTTRAVERYPLVRFAVYVPGLALAVLTVLSLFTSADPWAYVTWQRWVLLVLAVAVPFFIGMQIYRRLRSDSPIVLQQSRIILWGSILAFLPFFIWAVLSVFRPTPFNPWLYMPSTILFPLSIAYAMLRYNQLNFDRLLTASASYVIAGAFVVVIYFVIAYLISLVAGSSQTLFDNPGLAVFFVLLAVILLDRPRQHLERTIERVFFKGRYDTQTVLQNYSQRLTEVSDLTSVVQALREQVLGYFRPDVLYVYLLDVRMNAFVAQPDPTMPRLPSTATQWTLDSSLPRWLRSDSGAHFLQPGHALPEVLRPDQARVEMIGAYLYAPLTGHQQLNGWLALGPKQTGQIYSADDLSFLAALTNQTALALERAVVFDDLERRVSELNALSRISQAVNFTLDPDDILELIYTQTSRVIDTRNFYIALADAKRGTMRFAFYVEGNERLYPDDEWPIDTGLSGEIMRRGQPIITDDYVKECERRGLKAGGRPGRAWMGVPLNAGNMPMGIMVVSDFREEVAYSPEQLQIFAAIADQAASVLDKGRLYRETSERARQLAVLNEIGSSITSTLDLRTVLTTIMSKAMELLNAEAGSLLLVDEQRNELVFEVTLGPAAPDLRGQRLPMDKGIVGAAAQTRRPQIVNEAQQDTRWLRDMDKTTDYSTRALLAVPMIVKDKVTGVIELLNKRGMDSFTEDDQALLTAFAVNAAVAVDNARLFTMTDQALASRLDELSTLQEIDRQLNTSLDIRRVMEVTLDWGLRVIDAKAGSIALINRDDNTLVLMATHNYTYVPQSLPLDKGLAGHVARTGQPVLVNDISQDHRYIAGCPDTKSQLSVPIKRENEVIGVINLENPRKDSFSILHLDSASRLADHAAIAITNAQLYAAVNRANDAKGNFVNEVAHELAQPVTAIKGFNDLMVKGMAGPLSDMQKQFLSTIQFNAERLNTLIKDLLDIGRIETRRLKMDIGPVAIKPIIEETIRSLQSQIDERQMAVELNVPDDLPNILCDRSRLIQILTNLISNAYKYTPTGGRMTVTVSPLKEIQPRQAPRGNWTRTDLQQLKLNPAGYLACAVKDTGFGIAPEDQAKLFTQFFRSQNPSVREQRGTGLGLSITKSLIELQGGAIWVESELEKGSTFSFSLPVIENGEHEPVG